MIKVFQIYFDKISEQALEPGFEPFKNESEDDYFESAVMKEIYEMNPSSKDEFKYIGITSWKQRLKTRLTSSEILEHIQKDIDSGKEKDVYIYSPLQGVDISQGKDGFLHGIIRHSDIWDGHFHRNVQIEKDNQLLNNSGALPFNIFDGKWQYCKCNYWIAKREVFDEYCKTVLLPALKFYECPDVKASMPKWYRHSHTGNKYNSCLFTLEGLFGSFLAHSNYSFEYIANKKHSGKFQRIIIDGYERMESVSIK